jgi:hypothetical protein
VRPPPNDYVTTLGEAETGGDMLLLHNGQYRDDVVDLYIPGRGLDFAWKRSYQSGINLDGYLGKNWDFTWGAHFLVEYSGGTIPVRGRFSRGDCRRDLYDNAVLQSTRRMGCRGLGGARKSALRGPRGGPEQTANPGTTSYPQMAGEPQSS